jgi:RNA polymerase sigma-70 factor (ECF subfamily)
MHIFENLSDKLMKHEITNFKSWLFTVTRNECLMYFRKNKAAHKPLTENEEAELDEDYDLNYDMNLEQLKTCIITLKDEQRICLELFYFSNKSYEQISETMGIGIKQVKSAIQNGKRNLKIKMLEFSSNNAKLEI